VAGNKPMPTDALFWIASQSKSMTAAAFMMLVQEGKVETRRPCGILLAGVQGSENEVGEKPAHRSRSARSLATPAVAVRVGGGETDARQADAARGGRQLRQDAFAVRAGTKYQYSNAGINTAGRIIEVVSGMPYEKFMQDRLFGPLAMTDTNFCQRKTARPAGEWLQAEQGEDRPRGNDHRSVEISFKRPRSAADAGRRLFSTAHDVAVFCQMLLNKGTRGNIRFLSEDAVKQLTTKQTGDAVKTSTAWAFRPAAAASATAALLQPTCPWTRSVAWCSCGWCSTPASPATAAEPGRLPQSRRKGVYFAEMM